MVTTTSTPDTGVITLITFIIETKGPISSELKTGKVPHAYAVSSSLIDRKATSLSFG